MLKIITIDNAKNWDRIVKTFNTFDVYYLSGYVKAFQVHGDGEPILFYYSDDSIKAINVAMKNDIATDSKFNNLIPLNKLFDIATPYGYGGFLVEGNINSNSLEKLRIEYENLCKNEGIVSELVKFHPVLNNVGYQNNLYEIKNLGKTITIDLNSRENIWNTLSSKNRNMIRKANKSNVEIKWGRDIELFKQFIPLYNSTMDKNNARNYYYFKSNFYDSIFYDLKYNSLIFYAVFEKKIIAMSIIVFAGQMMNYHLSAASIEFKHLAAVNLLLYEASCWGNENGYKTFHLGGGVGSKKDSLFEFKSAFNKNSVTRFSLGRKIFDTLKYNELLEIRKKDLNFKEDPSFLIGYRQ